MTCRRCEPLHESINRGRTTVSCPCSCHDVYDQIDKSGNTGRVTLQTDGTFR